jgi:hypothetical protein
MTDNNNECPKSVDDLVAQKYMPKKQKDPWNHDFILRCPGTVSPDGIDVVSWGRTVKKARPTTSRRSISSRASQ